MDSAIQIALIVAISSTVSPLVLALITNHSRRLEKIEDYARQDAVAAKAESAAALLLDRQNQTAAKAETVAKSLLAANDRVAEASQVAVDTARVTNNKLDVIHTLVNSQLTAAVLAQYESVKRELVLMREVSRLHEAAGRPPSPDSLDAIQITEKKIVELMILLNERGVTPS